MSSSKNLRSFLQGIQFYMQIKGLKVNVYSPSRQVIVNKKIKPNFTLDVDGLNLCLKFINDLNNQQLLVSLNMSLNHIMMIDMAI